MPFEVRGPLLASGIGGTLLGILELVGGLRSGVDVAVEYNGAPFVFRRPSTPLSLAKPTEPLIAPVVVVSYLAQD